MGSFQATSQQHDSPIIDKWLQRTCLLCCAQPGSVHWRVVTMTAAHARRGHSAAVCGMCASWTATSWPEAYDHGREIGWRHAPAARERMDTHATRACPHTCARAPHSAARSAHCPGWGSPESVLSHPGAHHRPQPVHAAADRPHSCAAQLRVVPLASAVGVRLRHGVHVASLMPQFPLTPSNSRPMPQKARLSAVKRARV
jgi:hypothetical protein